MTKYDFMEIRPLSDHMEMSYLKEILKDIPLNYNIVEMEGRDYIIINYNTREVRFVENPLPYLISDMGDYNDKYHISIYDNKHSYYYINTTAKAQLKNNKVVKIKINIDNKILEIEE